MSRPLTVDSDGHILEPPDLWERYLEPKYRDRAIRIKVNARGLEYVEVNGMPSYMQGGTLGEMGGAYQDPVELMTAGKVTYWESATRTPGAIDPLARVNQMDEEGIDIALLFPTIGICWEGACSEPEISAAYCRAYNNYLFDFCSAQPERLIPIAHVNLCDVNLAAAEVERVKSKAKGIFITPFPGNRRPFGDRYYDPFWAACEAARLPVSSHVQVRPDSLGAGLHIPTDRAEDNPIWFQAMQLPVDSLMALNCMFQGGVLERFPTLDYVILEAGCGWLPGWLDRADGKWEMFAFATRSRRRPSEVFRERCWISADVDESCIPLASRMIGAKRLMWATDYPHIDAHREPIRELREHIAELPPEDQEWILGKTAAQLYRL